MALMLVLLSSLPFLLYAHPSLSAFEGMNLDRPTCQYGDTCEVAHPSALQALFPNYHLSFCECPENRKCTRSAQNSMHRRDGTLHVFCEEVKFPMCEAGDISMTISGMQTNVKCVCPTGMVEKHTQLSRWNTAVVCDYVFPKCQTDEVICGYYDGSRTLVNKCECPPSYGCIFPFESATGIATCKSLA